MKPLKVLMISDQLPGHFNLSKGIVAAVERFAPVVTLKLDVARRDLTPGRVLAAATNAGLAPSWILSLGYGIESEVLPAIDLIVSAGGDTLAANVAAARITGAPNVFYGSLRAFKPKDFALVLTSYAQRASLPQHVMALKPSELDPDKLSPPPTGGNVLPPVLGLLVGGDTSDTQFTGQDWELVASFLAAAHEACGTRWIVANSRRTPPRATALFSKLSRRADGPILTFIDFARSGPGTLTELFARSAAVLVTVDSSSMVSEVVWARRPVVALVPRESELPEAEAEYRSYLEENDWARSLSIGRLSVDALAEKLGEIRPLTDNPLDRLATLLKERIPSLVQQST
jgi:hypothetical protein